MYDQIIMILTSKATRKNKTFYTINEFFLTLMSSRKVILDRDQRLEIMFNQFLAPSTWYVWLNQIQYLWCRSLCNRICNHPSQALGQKVK